MPQVERYSSSDESSEFEEGRSEEQRSSENGLETQEIENSVQNPKTSQKAPGDLRERYICAFEVPVDELKGTRSKNN